MSCGAGPRFRGFSPAADEPHDATQWGSDGRFASTLTNALNQSVTQGWDAALGVPASVTDPNGITTTWSYGECDAGCEQDDRERGSVVSPDTFKLFRNISSDYVPAFSVATATELASDGIGLATDIANAGQTMGLRIGK